MSTEKQTQYTPGPWRAVPRDVGNDGTKDGEQMGTGLGWDIKGPPEPLLRGQFDRAADAYLIAAAPALLEAAKATADYMTEQITVGSWDQDDVERHISSLEAAIAAADGRTT